MKRCIPIAAVPVLALTLGIAASTKPISIQGAWRTVEVLPGPGAPAITNVQPNLMVLTARHYSRVEIHAAGPRPVVADVGHADADQLRATWGPLFAEAGTYEIRGNVVTMRPIVSKNPASMSAGTFNTFTLKLVGDTLWITSATSEKGPVQAPVTVKAVRVEASGY
jgi:hypothetical protein